jgi:protein-tyrosine sulfotransferase
MNQLTEGEKAKVSRYFLEDSMNKPILITGCQRSGTTLLHLILDSHPDITGIDETDVKKASLNEYLNDPKYHPCVSFKLPIASYETGFIKTIPGIKVIWCIRDPRDVILSMMKLTLEISKDTTLPWVAHPGGAGSEIENSARALHKSMSDELIQLCKSYKVIAGKQPASWSQEEMVFVASLCWRIKQELLAIYYELGIAYMVLHYENLVKNPENTIRDVLQFVGLPWHDNVLKHHQLHSGVSVGGTVNSRPIDKSNIGKWADAFDTRVLSIIKTVCAGTAARYGYRLSD